jgi:hypothetical protein
MDTREQHRVVCVRARPSSWPLVERSSLRVRASVRMPQPWSIYEGITAHAAEPIGRLSDSQQLDRGGVRLTSNCATNTSPIQYP